MARLSVIIPTIGRVTLGRALESIDFPVDLVVIGHDVGPGVKELTEMFGGRYFEYQGEKVNGGGPVRDWALEQKLAEGTHIVWQDDHDAFVPGALQGVEDVVRDIPALFSFIDASGTLLTPDNPLQHGQVDGHQLVIPNIERYGTWGKGAACDWDFIDSTLRVWGMKYDKHYFPLSTARVR